MCGRLLCTLPRLGSCTWLSRRRVAQLHPLFPVSHHTARISISRFARDLFCSRRLSLLLTERGVGVPSFAKSHLGHICCAGCIAQYPEVRLIREREPNRAKKLSTYDNRRPKAYLLHLCALYAGRSGSHVAPAP